MGTLSVRTVRVGLAITLSSLFACGVEYFFSTGRGSGFYNRDFGSSFFLSQYQLDLSRSVVRERSNVMGDDDCRRSAPEIIRDPWVLGRLSTENSRDDIDKTQSTRLVSMRRNASFLGGAETWAARLLHTHLFGENYVRHIIRTSGRVFPEDLARGRNKTLPMKKMWDKFDWDDLENFPVTIAENFENSRLDHVAFNTSFAFDWLIRNPQFEKVFEMGRALLLTHEINPPDRLAGIDEVLAPAGVSQYTSLNEFSRKKKARNCIFNASLVTMFIDIVLATQFPVKSVSTRQQQRELHTARKTLKDYIVATQRHFDMGKSPKLYF